MVIAPISSRNTLEGEAIFRSSFAALTAACVALRMAFSENSLAVEWLGAPHQVVVYPITVSEEGAIENEN